MGRSVGLLWLPLLVATSLGCQRAVPATSAAATPPRSADAPLRLDSLEAYAETIDFPQLRRQRDSLRARAPAQDARDAAAAGNVRLWGLEGHSLVLPGVPAHDFRRARQQYGYQVFAHTGDFVGIADGDSSWVWWQEAAADYAERYNRAMLRLVPLRP